MHWTRRIGQRSRDHHRIIALIVLLTCIGCGTTPLPLGTRQLQENGEEALKRGNYNDAIVNFTQVIEVHPNFVEALLARGDCFRRVAESRADDPSEQMAFLEKAVIDFDKAAASSTEVSVRCSAYAKAAITRVELGQIDGAIGSYEKIVAETTARPGTLALAYTSLANLLLQKIHAVVDLDHEVSRDNIELLREIRRVRHYYGESLRRNPRNIEALVGKGNCLLHEGLPQQAEAFFQSALAQDDQRRDVMYLAGVARERLIGVNRESNRRYRIALELDAERDFTPLYVRMFSLLQHKHTYSSREVESILRNLIEYRHWDERVWKAAQRYLEGRARSPLERLAYAVTQSRFGRTAKAEERFKSWWLNFENDPAKVEYAIDLVFRVSATQSTIVRGKLILARSKAYRGLYESGPYAARDSVWEALSSVNEELANMESKEIRNELHSRISGHLAEELLAKARFEKEITDDERSQLLQESYSLTKIEMRTSDKNYEAEYRFGVIEQERAKDPKYPLETALRAIEIDRTNTFAPAYQQLARAVESAPRADFSEEEKAIFAQCELAMLGYRGADGEILRVKDIVMRREQQRETARQLAIKEQLRLREERAEQERRKRLYRDDPCGDCGFTAKKTASVCPGCGTPFKKRDSARVESTATDPAGS